MKVTVIFDNDAKEGLKSGWGFSCLIENGKSILFDCGSIGEALIHNLKEIGIDPESIDIIVLSHEHGDHTGGLPDILEIGKEVRVLVPESFSRDSKDMIRKRAGLAEIGGRQEISANVYTTGELDSAIGTKEQALLLKTPEGVVVITGCAHPGLAAMIREARKLGKIRGLIGGFHGFSDYEALEGIRMLAPCHCTKHAKEIRELYPESCIKVEAGSVIEL